MALHSAPAYDGSTKSAPESALNDNPLLIPCEKRDDRFASRFAREKVIAVGLSYRSGWDHLERGIHGSNAVTLPMVVGLIVALSGLGMAIIAAVRNYRAQQSAFQEYWLAP
jgi:hypothetical protein